MQHPKAKQPFTHFASRRLRKEAPEELKKIHKEVSSMMKVLLRANHSHTLDFTREQEQAARMVEEASQQVQEASRQVQDANERASKAEEEAERLRKEMAATQYILSSVLGPGASGTASTSSNPM
jgi:methyl-accepting chemotaxis protein